MEHQDLRQVEVQSEAELWDWLAAHHREPDSVWLVTWKAAHRDRFVSREAVLNALIAYGWIDGRRMKLDDARTLQLISPRRQQAWAKSYKDRAARLEAEGRMQPAGRSAVRQGQESGLWHSSDPVDALIDPEDLLAALAAAGGLAWWSAAAPSYRRNILRWIAAAKQDVTREKRIGLVVHHAVRGEKVPHY